MTLVSKYCKTNYFTTSDQKIGIITNFNLTAHFIWTRKKLQSVINWCKNIHQNNRSIYKSGETHKYVASLRHMDTTIATFYWATSFFLFRLMSFDFSYSMTTILFTFCYTYSIFILTDNFVVTSSKYFFTFFT